MDLAWAESRCEGCRITGKRFFMKQASASGFRDRCAVDSLHLLIHEFPEPSRIARRFFQNVRAQEIIDFIEGSDTLDRYLGKASP